jgi:hypothetical protein
MRFYTLPSEFSLDVKTSTTVVISALDVDAVMGFEDGALVSFVTGLDGTAGFLDSFWGITCGMVETLIIVGALVSFLTSGALLFLTVGAVDGFLLFATFEGLCDESFMLGFSDGMNCFTAGFALGFP